MDRKRQRGQHRKLRAMFSYIDKFIPFVQTDLRYEHFHVPSDMFIESNQTSGTIKTEFCRKWLKTTEEFISQKPTDVPFCKVIAFLSVPHYWSSQIIIFYDENYFNSFWNRTGPEQFWIPTEQGYSFCKERNIATSLQEICYHEKIDDDDGVFEDDLWFYGDLIDG